MPHHALLCYLAVCLFSVGSEAPDATAKELAKFQGTWVLTSVEKEGQQAGADHIADVKLVIENNKRTLRKGDQVLSESTFKLDHSKSPKVILVSITEGALKGKTLPGIYEFDGDSHRLNLAMVGIDPPKGFTTEMGDGCLLQVFTKAK